MSSGGNEASRAPTWARAMVFTLGLWIIGAYLPQLSSFWVQLNVLVGAGKPHLFTLPLAYPAVGIDLHTLASLSGLLLVIGAATRWLTYIEHAWHTEDPGPPHPPARAAPGAPPGPIAQ